MNLLPQIQEALSNLLASKLRSILALLGVLVGTASVVAMVSCGQLATKQALKQFDALGTDLLSVSMFAEDNRARELQKTTFTATTIQALRTVSPAIIALAPYANTFSVFKYEGETQNGGLIGATQALKEVIKLSLQRGRFISDLDGNARYCVLGNALGKTLQEKSLRDIVGTQLWVGNEICTIVGVLAPWPENNFFSEDVNHAVMMPLEAYESITPFSAINNLIMTLQKDVPIEVVEATLRASIESKMQGLNIYFRSAKQLLKSMAAQSRIFTLLLGLIGSISLFVGGIGIMNIMLVSVTERKKEIGIRMAIGATRGDIRNLFLVESIILCLLGGLVGVMVGILVAAAIAFFAHWTFSLLFLPIFSGFVVSVMVGIFFGFYPAYQAAQLDPIQILRSE